MRNNLLMIFAFLICIFSIISVSAISPTNNWQDFYGKAVGGKAGDVITAKDPQGILCGTFSINKAGQYGFLHVYADDSLTKVDEGAKAGDVIGFYYNNKKIGSGIWDGNKDIINLDLTIKTCTENWRCSAWSKCVKGVKTRTCSDINQCGTFNNKPAESQKCRFIWF